MCPTGGAVLCAVLLGAAPLSLSLSLPVCWCGVVRGRYPDGETKDYLRLKAGGQSLVSRGVDGSGSIEICVATYWSTTASAELEMVATFSSAVPSASHLALAPGCGFQQVHVNSAIRDIMVSPEAKLDKWRTPIRPTASSIAPMSVEHDLLEGKTLHQLALQCVVDHTHTPQP